MEDNWTSYDFQRPPKVLCEFLDRNGKQFTANPEDFGQMFNIGGLKWRLTGIGREQLASSPHLENPPRDFWQQAANSNLCGGTMSSMGQSMRDIESLLGVFHRA